VFSLPYRFLTVYLSFLYFKCDGNIFAYKGLIDGYAKTAGYEHIFEMILHKMSKEFSTCYLFFKNRHQEPDMVTEFFEMFLRNEKPYARLCYDLSLVYRSPATTFHDIDITGWKKRKWNYLFLLKCCNKT